MTKPIFTVGLPNQATQEILKDVQSNLDGQFNDYHVLVYSHFGEDVKFDCFYEKDFNQVKYEELKAIVKKRLK